MEPGPDHSGPDADAPCLVPHAAEPDLASESGPQRTCVVTRQKHSLDALIRFVLSPQGEVVADIRCKLPGRGVWLLARADIVAQAVKRQSFAKGFKTKVTAAPELVQQVDALLEKDALQSLSLANKAGVAVTGFAKVEAAASGEALAALVHATDAGPDGIRKLGQALRRRPENLPVPLDIIIFSSAQLDLAFGRTNVIHAAIRHKAAGAAFLVRALRLISYRTPIPPAMRASGSPQRPTQATPTL